MRRTLLLVTLVTLAMLMANGVALAKFISGTENGDTLIGTKHADKIFGNQGNDVVKGKGDNDELYGGSQEDEIYGQRGNDRIFGGDGQDREYGGKGRDRISSAGLERDEVNCGSGKRDFAEVDPLDQVVNCERVKVVEP